MNNFNKVFLVVKKHCAAQPESEGVASPEIVAKEAKIPLNKLGLYLDHLQDMGLIRFSMDENYIHLTAFGRKQEKLMRE